MTVKSSEIHNEPPRPTARPVERSQPATSAQPASLAGLRSALRFAGVLALAFGLPAWAVGAWYTLRGWVLGINIVLTILGATGRLTAPSGWWICLLFPVGLIYSITEVQLRPGRARYRRIVRAFGWGVLAVLFLLWSLVVVTDLGSTYLSMTTPVKDAWLLTKWIAVHPWAAGSWTAILTFLPEAFIMVGLALVFKK